MDTEDTIDTDNDSIVFRKFDEQSAQRLIERDEAKKQRDAAKKNLPSEGKLVDGEIEFVKEVVSEEDSKDKDPTLIEGNKLPDDRWGPFPDELIGEPIEEIDRYVKHQSYVVINKRFKKKVIFRFSASRAFFLFAPWSPIRRFACRIVTDQCFDYIIIITILVNCAFLALKEEYPPAEYTFLAVYTLEMLIKLFARGLFLNNYTYLRDPWNWLDITVIVSSYIMIVVENVSSGGSGVSVNSLRTFRVFRVLKTISILPGLKTIIGALLKSFKMLFEVITLTLFCMSVFALFALQVYMGVLRQKCVRDINWAVVNLSQTNFTSSDDYYNDWINTPEHWLRESEAAYWLCGNWSGAGTCSVLAANHTCLPGVGDNPNWGYTTFDDFGWSLVSIFQLITLDFWEDLYDKVIRATGPWNILFFIVVVFFGSFYLINLMLAVVTLSYEEEAVQDLNESESDAKAQQKKKKLKTGEKRKRPPQKSAASNGAAVAAESNGLVNSAYVGDSSAEVTAESPVAGQISEPADSGIDESSEPAATNADFMNTIDSTTEEAPVAEESKEQATTQVVDSPTKKANDMSADVTEPAADKNSAAVAPPQPKEVVKERQQTPKALLRKETQETLDSFASTTTATMNGTQTTRLGSLGSQLMMSETIMEEPICEDMKPARTRTTKKPHVIISDNRELVDRNCSQCKDCCISYMTWLRFQNALYNVVTDAIFELFITLCILLNTSIMASEHYPSSPEWDASLEISNYFFTSIFIMEALLKLMAMSKSYFKSAWNVFDLVVVIASIIDLGVQQIDSLSIFRTFRLFRVFKLAQSWHTMRMLLTIIFSTVSAIGNLTFILLIVIYIFAVIGMQLFRTSYTSDVFGHEEESIPRWNFVDFWHSMMMVFRILCGEWIEPLWDCIRANGTICMAVFIPALILGNFMVLNLFLALLLNSFASDSLKKEATEDDSKLRNIVNRLRTIIKWKQKYESTRGSPISPSDSKVVRTAADKFRGLRLRAKSPGEDSLKNGSLGTMPKTISQDDENTVSSGGMVAGVQPCETQAAQIEPSHASITNIHDMEDKNVHSGNTDTTDSANGASISADEPTEIPVDLTGVRPTSGKVSNKKVGVVTQIDEADDDEEDENRTLEVADCCFPVCHRFSSRICCTCWECSGDTTYGRRWTAFRLVMLKVIEHKLFEAAVLFVILASSVALCFEDIYLDDKPKLSEALRGLNILFISLFILEMLVKQIAQGLRVYFTHFWTLLDFFIVVISLISLIAEQYGSADLQAFRSLRTLRALRPLRAISRWQGMRIVVNALMYAIPSILNVLLVCGVFWLIFSITGVQLFKGKFYKCENEDGERLSHTVVENKEECLAKNYTWRNSYVNFDNVGNGYVALFQIATFEGWMEIMRDAIDSDEIDKQPRVENVFAYYIYFVIFIIFGSFFTLNLFIGVIIDNFNALKKKYEGSYLDMFLTQSQKNYYNTMRKLGNKKPKKTIRRPKNKLQDYMFDIAISSKFELLIVILIFLNMVAMMLEHYGQPAHITRALELVNVVFTTIFLLEAVVKIVGMRWYYFTRLWNIFDFIIVILSIIGLIVGDIMDQIFITPTLLRVFRIFRIGRVLRLIKMAKGIRKLLFALVISLPALFNIGALLLLVVFIYAIIGMSSFGNIRKSGALNDMVNFETFGRSMVLLFRLTTSGGWNEILDPLVIQPPDCDSEYAMRGDRKVAVVNGDCGQPWLATIYMITFVLFTFMIVINMYIAVILENFNQAHEQEEVGITDDDFDMFYVVWEKYDQQASQYIHLEKLSNFVAELDEPLGIPKPNLIALVSFDIPISTGEMLHCLDILMALVKNVLGEVDDTAEFTELRAQMEAKFQEAFPSRVKTAVVSTTLRRKKEDIAAKTLQRAWRSHKTQKAFRKLTETALISSRHKSSISSSTPARSFASATVHQPGNHLNVPNVDA